MNDIDIDTCNKFMVAAMGTGIVIMSPPRGTISEEDARLLAAYLVAMTGGLSKFEPVLDAVEGA